MEPYEKQGDQGELFELKANIYRDNTTKCTRVGGGDRRTERSHQYRMNHCQLMQSPTESRSVFTRSPYIEYKRGRRHND
jgi:hypothetical protein